MNDPKTPAEWQEFEAARREFDAGRQTAAAAQPDPTRLEGLRMLVIGTLADPAAHRATGAAPEPAAAGAAPAGGPPQGPANRLSRWQLWSRAWRPRPARRSSTRPAAGVVQRAKAAYK